MDSTLISRKFLIALVAMLSCSFLMYFKLISDGVYSTIMVATVGAYLTANVMQKSVELAGTSNVNK